MGSLDRDEERRREARAILERVARETSPQVGAGIEGTFSGVRRHFSAADADPGDRIEVMGTRIGRGLGLVAFVILAALLVMRWIG
ncbi:hypothetical protein [Consotaella salsifontis]|uniref:Uncharacterized protein n=1 Tax=Consotaella salsifontis TaxID=1365950 RepID=A0A1T4T4X1_9HYPH|nr:hypothetical protein [Consotaella salsifontis]SKA35554.1 hypothetical protein SAMN05428963_11960 [Consotaella salsifontis]